MMELTYNFEVPDDWPSGAKDYYRMGQDDTGMANAEGISTFLVRFAATTNFEIPFDAQQAWGYITSHVLNIMPLPDSGWEDLKAETTGLQETRCQIKFRVVSEDGEVDQPLITINLYRDNPPKSSDDETFLYSVVDVNERNNSLSKLTKELEPVIGEPMTLLSRYYSPSYRKVKNPNTDVEMLSNENGHRVRRRVYCKEPGGPTRPAQTHPWWIEIQTFHLSEAFLERYVPLSLEEDEASVFFGHIPLQPITEILHNAWRNIKSSVRLLKARMSIL